MSEVAAASGTGDARNERPGFREATDFFRQHRALIGERYASEFVAVLDGAAIDHDHDYRLLEARCRLTFPGRSPYLVYAGAVPLSELLSRFEIKVEVDEPSDRRAWEEQAARDATRDSHE